MNFLFKKVLFVILGVFLHCDKPVCETLVVEAESMVELGIVVSNALT